MLQNRRNWRIWCQISKTCANPPWANIFAPEKITFSFLNSELSFNFENVENTCDALTRTPGTRDCDSLFFDLPGNVMLWIVIHHWHCDNDMIIWMTMRDNLMQRRNLVSYFTAAAILPLHRRHQLSAIWLNCVIVIQETSQFFGN